MLNNTRDMTNAADIGEFCSRCEQSSWPEAGTAILELDVAENDSRHPARTDAETGDFVGRPPCQDRKQRAAAARIEKAISYMSHNLNGTLRISSLGKLVGTSTSNFYHLFKLATGSTPNRFFIRARMRRAGRLLIETTLSVKEIAAELGYNDQFYFSRLFKSVNGISPRGYREALQSKNARASRPVTKTVTSFAVSNGAARTPFQSR